MLNMKDPHVSLVLEKVVYSFTIGGISEKLRTPVSGKLGANGQDDGHGK